MFQIQTKPGIPKYKTCLIIQQSSIEQLQYTKHYYRFSEYSHEQKIFSIYILASIS